MNIPHKVYGVIEITDSDLDRLVKKVFGKEWSFVADIECGNDSIHRFNVRKEELDDYDLKKFMDWWTDERHVTFMARIILTKLCNMGQIIPGVYLVSVSW